MKGRLKRIGRLSLYQKNITFRKASPKGSSLERFPTLSIYIFITLNQMCSVKMTEHDKWQNMRPCQINIM